MAREKMITRTVKATTGKVLGINLNTQETYLQGFTLTGEFKDEKEILKTVKNLYEDDEHVLAKVITIETFEKLYGMPESVFMKYAKELPPRKVYEQ